jgi:hypothetical protein
MGAETRSLDCPKCGAPLDWSGDVAVIECAYCESHIAVASKTITPDAAQAKARTAPRPEPPPRPLPDRRPASRSGQPWWSRASRGHKIAAVGGTLAAAAVMVAAIVWLSRPKPPGAPAEVRLRALEPEADQKEVVALLGNMSAVDPNRVTVDFRAGGVRRAEVYWEPPDTRSITAVNLFGAGGFDVDAITGKLRPLAPNRLIKINAASWEIRVGEGELSISPHAISVRSHRRADPRWKARFAAFWAAARFAVLGGGEPTAEQRKLLNGATLAEVAAVDTALAVEQAADGFTNRFAGGTCRPQAGLLCTVDVDDARIAEVRFGWPNAVGGRLHEVALMFVRGTEVARAQRSLAACLEPVLGKGTEEVTDAIRNTRRFTWPVGAEGDSAVIESSFFGLIVAEGAPATRTGAWAAQLPAIFAAVAGCQSP